MKLKFLLLLSIAITTLLNAEPSAFGAGDLNSKSPYGLTETEKSILKNKKLLKEIKNNSYNQVSEIDSLRERIDGLQTIIEGLNKKSQDQKIMFKSFQEAYRLDQQSLQRSDMHMSAKEKEYKEIVEKLAAGVKANDENVNQLMLAITELSIIIDTINSSYVSKEEHNNLVNELNELKALVVSQLKAMDSATQNPFEDKTNAQVAKEAKVLYDAKKYTKASTYYEYLIQKSYKPARSNYMIAESYYYKEQYKKALAHYKESASLYSKADYMPTLMLHTAIAMDKTGDKTNAKKFYNAVIKKFPNSNSAKVAKKRVAKLK